MNAGKSTSLLQSNHNYKVRDLKTYIFTPKVDAELHQGKIHSRLGVEEKANVFDEHFNFCLLYTSPSPRDRTTSRMPSSA